MVDDQLTSSLGSTFYFHELVFVIGSAAAISYRRYLCSGLTRPPPKVFYDELWLDGLPVGGGCKKRGTCTDAASNCVGSTIDAFHLRAGGAAAQFHDFFPSVATSLSLTDNLHK